MQFRELVGLHGLDISNNSLTAAPKHLSALKRLRVLNLSNNDISEFPDLSTLGNLVSTTSHVRFGLLLIISTNVVQEYLDISYNKIKQLPTNLPSSLKNMTSLIATHNKLEDIPADLAEITTLDVRDNPLSTIPDAVRTDMEKVIFYCVAILIVS